MARRTAIVFGVASSMVGLGGVAPGQVLRLASVMPDGTQLDEAAYDVDVSGDGDVVAFEAADHAFDPNSNLYLHVFVRVMSTGALEDPCIDPNGAPITGTCGSPAVSGDGRYVAFAASSIYIRDRLLGVTGVASISSSGAAANGSSGFPFLSPDGRFVLFSSNASNLVAGDGNGKQDVFLRDRTAGTTERVSVASGGGDPNGYSWPLDVSDDGRYSLIISDATNLVAGDTNNKYDLFVFDRTLGTTERVSVSSSGAQSNGTSFIGASMNGDGSLVVFDSNATNLVTGDTNGKYDIFLRDRAAGTTTRIVQTPSGAQTNGECWDPSISGDGLVVAFESRAKNLSPLDPNGHADIYLLDRPSGTTTLVSCAGDGTVADKECYRARLSVVSGQVVAFLGGAGNLDPTDLNGVRDVFTSDFTNCPIASWTLYGAGWPGTNGIPSLSLSADPDLGSTITLSIGNSLGAATPAILFFGFARASVPSNWGGTFLVDIAGSLALTVGASGGALTDDVPYDSALAGLALDVQGIELDPGATRGISFTPGLELVVGR